MQKFKYEAKKEPSEIFEGIIEAENLSSAIRQLTASGLTPIDVLKVLNIDAEVKQNTKHKLLNLKFSKRIKFKEIVIFTRQISDLVDASVPILQSMEIVSRQTRKSYFSHIIMQMHNYVRDGGCFSNALARYKNVFSLFYVSMVKTGEDSGNLSVSLERLSSYLEKEQENRGKIKASLAYPCLIMVVGSITIFVLLSFVVPRLSIMFDDLNQSLPLPTILLVNISNIFEKIWWILLSLIGFGIFGFRRWIKSYESQLRFDKFLLTIPFFGEFIKIVEIERFSRTLATQLETGVSITDALNSVVIVVGNTQLCSELKEVSMEVATGESLKDALNKTTFFPPMAVNMISIGEETARLERGLYKLADTYSRQAEQITKTIISLLGPLVLVFIVTIVGFVIIAMLLPIFKMNLLIE